MNTITIRKKLGSTTIRLGKEAEALVGKNVEIVIRELVETQPVKKNGQQLEVLILVENSTI